MLLNLLIPFLSYSFLTFIAIECVEEELHYLLLEKYGQFSPVTGTGEELDRSIREKALSELNAAILPYTPDLIVNDLISLRTQRPNITASDVYMRVKTSRECVGRRLSGIFTDYNEYVLDVALLEVDWSNPIRCPNSQKCKVALGFEFQTLPRYMNKSALVGMKGWKLADSFDDGTPAEADIGRDLVDLSDAAEPEGVSNHLENDDRREESAAKNWTKKKYSYEFPLDENVTLISAVAVAAVTSRRIPYEMLDFQPLTKFNLFNVNVSQCAHLQNGTGCMARCEHFIVDGVTPKGLARHAHRLCWWDFFLEKIFLIRRMPLKLCDYDSKELTIPLREDGTFFSTQFWFEHSRTKRENGEVQIVNCRSSEEET